MVKKVIVPAGAVFGTVLSTQYLFTSNVYYDEYDGHITEFRTQ